MHRVLHGLVGVSFAVMSRDVVFVLSDPSLLWHRRVEASVAKNFVEEDPGGNGHAELLCCVVKPVRARTKAPWSVVVIARGGTRH